MVGTAVNAAIGVALDQLVQKARSSSFLNGAIDARPFPQLCIGGVNNDLDGESGDVFSDNLDASSVMDHSV